MAEASVLASLPRRRFRRPVKGARISSAASARFSVSNGTADGSWDDVESSGSVCERVGGGGRGCAGVSDGVRAP